MYIGSTDARGLHHMIQEIVDNAVDEHSNGFGNKISIDVLQEPGKVDQFSVRDYGRGVPVGFRKDFNMDVLTAQYTMLFTGGKFDAEEDEQEAYNDASGTNGVGVKAVTALSDYLRVVSFQPKKSHSQEFSRGAATSEVVVSPSKESGGTLVVFRPDSGDPLTNVCKYTEMLGNIFGYHLNEKRY
jgi:DNA gyrase/topoisomerase IV subunit B